MLLDELGVGTDPSAGSAMGMAILESLTLRGTVTAATTHYDALKAFATRTEGVENGSMVFNVENLTPSYQFRQGIPGASYAIEIGNRLGMPEEVLERTSHFMGSSEKRLDEVIMDVDRKHELLVSAQEQADNLRDELDSLKRTYENQIDSYKQKERDLVASTREKTDRLLKEAREAIDEAVASVRREQASSRIVEASRNTVRDQRALLQNMLDSVDPENRTSEPEDHVSVPESPGQPFSVGDEVWVESVRQAGKVLQDQGDRLRIQTGRMEITARRSEVSLSKPSAKPPGRTSTNPVQVRVDRPRVPLSELDVRGYRAREAVDAVDRYIDQTVLDDLGEIRILHGKGTGALSSAIQEFLQQHPLVKSSHFAEQRDGGTGVTIVEMKD